MLVLRRFRKLDPGSAFIAWMQSIAGIIGNQSESSTSSVTNRGSLCHNIRKKLGRRLY